MSDIDTRVAQAADALMAANMKVSADSVRQKLGGGSLRDISPALRRWREHQVSANPDTVPAEVTELGHRAIATIWAMAERLSGEAVDGLRREHTERQAALMAELDEAMQEIAALEASTKELGNKNDVQGRELEHLRERSARAEAQAEASISARAEMQRSLETRETALSELWTSERNARDEAAELRGRLRAVEERLERIERDSSRSSGAKN